MSNTRGRCFRAARRIGRTYRVRYKIPLWMRPWARGAKRAAPLQIEQLKKIHQWATTGGAL